ncbi:MAG: LacI family transcriptional regulator [Victivallaceae bacterium]|nr:LacI family transcriptional regulator [Victivallaceae bacterium]
MKEKLTLKDIAELSGVSLTTASMYINGKAKQYRIAQSTCERIKQVIEKHKFHPNTHARAIAGKKTFLLGVIISGQLNYSFWMDILDGIEATVAAQGYHLLLSVVRATKDNDEMLKILEFTVNKGVDGIIFASLHSNEMLTTYLKKLSQQKPLVSVTVPTTDIPAVYNDNAAGGRTAAEYLYQTGHRKIAYIGIHEHPDQRNVAFFNHLAEYGIEVAGFYTAVEFAPRMTEFTAVGCFSDYNAMNVYQLAAERGITIPDELSVIGFDNMNFTTLMHPPLTTVNQHKEELGVAAAESLMAQIDDREQIVEDKVFTPELVIRGSVREL